MLNLQKIYLFSITLSIIIAVSICEPTCKELADNPNCDFYEKCLEVKFKCGPTGYPLGYGGKYCKKFTKLIDIFPDKGQQWIRKTLNCLKYALLPFSEGSNCKTIFNTAFDSHPQCYFDSGFCELFLDVKQLPTLMRALVNVYEVKDFASALSMKQIFLTAKMCGGDYIRRLTDALKEIFKS